MIEVDLHSHSHFSHCGLHSFIEMLTHAKNRGMKGLAITDHTNRFGARLNTTFFDRLFDPVPGIRLLKGVEANVLDEEGEIDVPLHSLKHMDVVLLGYHPLLKAPWDKNKYTDRMVGLIEKFSFIDILTHLNQPEFPVDFLRIAQCAKEHGVAIELNNSKTAMGRCPDEMTFDMLQCVKETKCRLVVNSDAHALNEVGEDDAVQPLLQSANFPEDLILNSTAQKAFDFIEERRIHKLP